MRYIDSSAFVKYYSEESAEKGANIVKEIIDNAKEGRETLISSILLVGEVISAFDKWARTGILSKENCTKTIAVFVNDIKELTEKNTIVLEDVRSIGMISAVDYIVNYHLTVNDAIHLYTALINKDKIECFVSSDNNLNTAAKKSGLKVFDPEN
ncbi:MAG: type II toxin-antitoxin system VapC family toxin [Candidatus Aenigmarchaeota archaeon]|nr:type II toxin-antitoxin system VapC family toxin [Candidatus Aenigmarchaeota archaeon]